MLQPQIHLHCKRKQLDIAQLLHRSIFMRLEINACECQSITSCEEAQYKIPDGARLTRSVTCMQPGILGEGLADLPFPSALTTVDIGANTVNTVLLYTHFCLYISLLQLWGGSYSLQQSYLHRSAPVQI